MKFGNDFLPELDAEKTKQAVIDAFEKYRLYRYLTFEEREAITTASYSLTPRSETGVASDQTGNIAIYNVDAQAARKAYCDRIERAVARLPRMERFLIERRYMAEDSKYITDQHVYNFEFQPPISQPTYKKFRWEAFYKLALHLRIAVKKEETEDSDNEGRNRMG